jgi:hypothetical protein
MDLPSVYFFVILEWSLSSPFIDKGERRVTCMCYMIFFLGRKIRGLCSRPIASDVPLLEECPLSFDAVGDVP